MIASGIPPLSLVVLLVMVGASDKCVAEKVGEQQAFEFLLILSIYSWFDTESALEMCYIITIGHGERILDIAFRGTV